MKIFDFIIIIIIIIVSSSYFVFFVYLNLVSNKNVQMRINQMFSQHVQTIPISTRYHQ